MLKDISFETLYSSDGTEHSPREFFTQALSNSDSFDLGLGYFSTASFNVLSYGFAKFISNGGRMRLYINQYLSDEDYDAIVKRPKECIEEIAVESFEKMKLILSKRDQHFFDCLSFLIANKRIEIKIIIPKSGGIAHQKLGIFTDIDGNKVAFNGSVNFSASAILSKNIEATSCFCSWDGDEKHISAAERVFHQYFNGEIEDTIVFNSEKLEKSIIQSFPPREICELIADEKILIEKVKEQQGGDFSVIDSQISDTSLPRFPYSSGPRPYQVDAYNSWSNNGFCGIFAMATGTGKTITSLNCVLQEYKKNSIYKVLILVPTTDLVNQWVNEVANFNFSDVFVVNGSTNWREELVEMKNDFGWGIEHNYVIISTYASFTKEVFQQLVRDLSDNNTILIADEAHNVGSHNVRQAFDSLSINKRIALSATPNRAYDIEGTTAIENYFKDKPPYCYSFSMERAIQEGYLMRYLYYPVLVMLEPGEMSKYAKYTKQLLQYFDSKTKTFKDNPEVEKLLMKRKSLIHKAHGKYSAFSKIVDELCVKNLAKYCFVYTPEGVDYSVDEDTRMLENLRSIVTKQHPEVSTNSFVGSDSDKKDKLRAFAEGKIDMLFAMKCLDEGVDVPRAEVGIFTSSTGNPRQFIQRRGRLLRKHKDKNFATIYDMVVVPNFLQIDETKTFEMEKSLVRSELMRVAYFASLASNYNSAVEQLSELTDHYGFEISTLIKELKEQ